MCGIVGLCNFNGKSVFYHQIEKMTNSIKSRGPDGKGFFVDKNFGMGHRRLAVIDLSERGNQPMSDKEKKIWVSYNGEIYNFLELRKELEKLGYRFSSRTDTEVIIYSYKEWGINCVNKFNGMFAFALWDKRKREFFLARDRYGIKPLYYYQNNKVFLFGSEIKPFFENYNFKKELDLEVLLEYFTFQNTFSYKTLFKGVKLLKPGHFMRISSHGKIDINKYWDFNFREDRNIKSEKEYMEELDRLFNQAVKRQLTSDVEIGSYLSGGVDTGAITAIASRFLPDFKTFCVGFDMSSASIPEFSFDERKKARHISSLHKTKHHEIILKSKDIEKCLPDLIWQLEDLRVGQSYPNFYASNLASKSVKVCLSGTGGDELFAGYPWRYYRILKSKTFEEYIKEYYKYWQRMLLNTDLKEMFSPISKEIKGISTEDIFKGVFMERHKEIKDPEDYIRNSLYFEAKTFLHGLLIVDDKLSMAHGLETRVPFLDNDLVDFALKVPINLKLKDIKKILKTDKESIEKEQKYFKKTNDGKIILRKTLSKYVGDNIANGKKQGFSGPDASWFKKDGIDYIREILLNKKANIYNYFDYKVTSNLIKDHLNGKQNRRLLIWSLLSFEEWTKVFKIT